MNVLVKEIDYNAMKRQVDEIDFQALVQGEKVHSVAEVVLVNHDKVAEGVLQLLLEEISYRALPSALRDKVTIDVGEMKVGDSIRVNDLDIAKDENVDLLTDREAIVVTVSEVHNKLDTDEEARKIQKLLLNNQKPCSGSVTAPVAPVGPVGPAGPVGPVGPFIQHGSGRQGLHPGRQEDGRRQLENMPLSLSSSKSMDCS